jgi:hypothetical protein
VKSFPCYIRFTYPPAHEQREVAEKNAPTHFTTENDNDLEKGQTFYTFRSVINMQLLECSMSPKLKDYRFFGYLMTLFQLRTLYSIQSNEMERLS